MTPDVHTNQEHFLDVGDGHQLYVQDWGNEDARTAVIYLHGGPGSGCQDKHKRGFDPTRQRIIFFDQRGSGRSLPYGSLEHNTTDHLVADIEKIADHLKLDRFILTGGSWGACLALAYAIAHPQRVAAMVLNGILTCSQDELDWVDKGGFKTFYPDAWERYLERTPKSHRHDPTGYHFKRLLGDDPQASKESGYAYQMLELAILQLDDHVTEPPYEDFDPASIRIEAHYLANKGFMSDRFILNNAHSIMAPTWLVQGRYDMVCPPATAYELHTRLSDSRLIWSTSGHRTERESRTVIRELLNMMARP